MPTAYVEDVARAFSDQQQKLRVELEQLQASARRLRQAQSGISAEERICDLKQVIAALGAALSTLREYQMTAEKSPHSLPEAEGSVQPTFMSLAADRPHATHGRIQGSHVLDPAE